MKFEFNNVTEYAEYVKEQANIVLDKCRIYGTAEDRRGLMDNIMMSINAKSWLFDLFKNHPGHNGKGQIIMPLEIERPVDGNVICRFADYIQNIAKKYYLTEATIENMTYSEVLDKLQDMERLIRAVDYMCLTNDEVIIKGKEFGYYREKYSLLQNIQTEFEYSSKYYYCGNNKYTTKENRALYNKALNISEAIRHCIGSKLEDETDIEKLAKDFPNSQCRSGIKITKVIQKCLKELGLYQIVMEKEKETFNKNYAAWCDAVSPKTFIKWSIFSINFVDFLTMCHGNSWTSCMNTDKDCWFTSGNYSHGFNSRRVLDYALDPSTIVFYTVDQEYDGDDWELQPKLTRQLFHFGEGKLIQSRLYPQSSTSRRNTYTQYRENVEKILADCMNEANLWSAPSRGTIDYDEGIFKMPYYYTSDGDYVDFTSFASHDCTERDFQSEVNYVVFRGSTNREDNGEPMMIGSTDAVCIMCGDSMREDYTESIACKYCKD